MARALWFGSRWRAQTNNMELTNSTDIKSRSMFILKGSTKECKKELNLYAVCSNEKAYVVVVAHDGNGDILKGLEVRNIQMAELASSYRVDVVSSYRVDLAMAELASYRVDLALAELVASKVELVASKAELVASRAKLAGSTDMIVEMVHTLLRAKVPYMKNLKM
ncbi:hypothetical protein SO802_002315 [Lithocarpus litseifolius]|uniref:Uncharacterized protein n=1 Tax=Lithocarpus litseifolius TaxID=425828 RepID=A0AAW2E2J1_9ROSI